MRSGRGCETGPPENDWTDYFNKIFVTQGTNNIKLSEIPFEIDNQYNEILDKNITVNEVANMVSRIKDNKSPGLEGINPCILKEIRKNLNWIKIITESFNKIKETNRIPKRCKKVEMIPIYKNKGNRKVPSNYRVISLLSTIFKVYTGILTSKMNEWCETYNKIFQWQNGFRKRRRTEDNLFILQTVFDKYLKPKRGKIYLCFVDLEKAFDTVHREKLWVKLSSLGISKLFF